MLLLRPATLHDLPALHDIERSATELYYEGGFSPTHVCPRSEADMRLLLKYTTVLLASEDDQPIGYASYYDRGPFMHLEEIAVRRDRQRRGCGRALALQALAAAQADPQCTHLSLVTYTGASWAVELYTGLGFVFLDPADPLPNRDLLQEIVDIEAAAGLACGPHGPRVPMIRPVREPAG
jgi:ribosomal protein S18 acetylase RimI-like enzyme